MPESDLSGDSQPFPIQSQPMIRTAGRSRSVHFMTILRRARDVARPHRRAGGRTILHPRRSRAIPAHGNTCSRRCHSGNPGSVRGLTLQRFAGRGGHLQRRRPGFRPANVSQPDHRPHGCRGSDRHPLRGMKHLVRRFQCTRSSETKSSSNLRLGELDQFSATLPEHVARMGRRGTAQPTNKPPEVSITPWRRRTGRRGNRPVR